MANGARLRVMSYNIKSFEADQSALTAVVREVAPDVLVVQEALQWWNPLTWFVNLGPRFGLVQVLSGLVPLGNAVFTAPRIQVHERWIVRYPVVIGHSLRTAVFARCSIAGAAFLIAGSHLSTDAATRLRQAGVLKAALNRAEAERSAPVMLGIDVNETAAGPAWRTVAAGLVDVAEKTGQGELPTFPTSGAFERIDAIFVDPRCSVLGYRIIDTPQSRVASDHFPILAEVALPGA
jgi:endonuclease/exonuclease/phosphatase family metal-dependent hydrolase